MNPPSRAWGSDRAAAAPDGALLLECSVGKSWVARAAGSQSRSEHPGTAVEWDGQVYEVLSVEALDGTFVRYRLTPWEDRHAIRRIERYDEESEAARHASRAELSAGNEKRRLAILFSPILGHLPGAVQAKMERDFGAPARAMTFVSAAPLFVLGALTILAALIGRFGGTPIVPQWMENHSGLFTYLAIESALRIHSAWIGGDPMGSLAGILAYAVWTFLRRGKAIPSAAATSPAPGLPAEQALTDRYTMLEPFLALLAPADQAALERSFGFDPRRWGRTTSLLILLVAGLSVLISIFAFLSHTGGLPDFAVFVIGSFLVVEQIGRRRALAAGKPAGSILGALVRPLARPLLSSPRG